MNEWFKDNPNFNLEDYGINPELLGGSLLSDNNPYAGIVKDVEPFEKIVINPIEVEDSTEEE